MIFHISDVNVLLACACLCRPKVLSQYNEFQNGIVLGLCPFCSNDM